MRRQWAVFCLVVAALLAPASPVYAHASFLTSDPVDGSVLERAPASATLHFSEEVLLDASRVELLHLGNDLKESLPLHQADDGATVVATMPVLPKGAYILRYTVVDPADLHRTVGSISFGIGVAAPPSTTGEQVAGSLLSSLVRMTADLALVAGGGAVAVLVLSLTNPPGNPVADRRRRRAARMVPAAAGLAAVAWLALLLVDVAAVGWGNVRWTSLLTASDPGRRVMIGAQLAIGVWWAVRLLHRAASAAGVATMTKVVALLWAAMVVVSALGGHTAIGGNELVGVLLRSMHLASLCLWIGAVGVTWLVNRGADRPAAAALWRRTSALAAWGLLFTGLSGLLLSGRTIATVTALFTTDYGRLVIAKSFALGGVALLGLVAGRRVSRGHVPGKRPLMFELGVAGVAMLLAAVLAGAVPAQGERFRPLVLPDPQVSTADVADLTVSASIQPARPGANLVQLRVLDTRRPSPGAVESVSVIVIDAAGGEVATLTGTPVDGLVEWDSLVLPAPGTYQVVATIVRPASPVPTFASAWTASAAPVPREHTVVSNRDFWPIAVAIAAGWSLAVLGAALLLRRRRSTLAAATEATAAAVDVEPLVESLDSTRC